MNCPKCNSPLREGAKFCTACGEKIASAETCPKCGAPLRPNAKFCTACGEKLFPAVKPEPSVAINSPTRASVPAQRESQSSAGDASSENVPADVASAENVPVDPVPVGNVPVDPAPAVNAIAGNRIYWNLQPGQVARVITDAEFEQYQSVRGVIVPEGTTAFIRANGKTIASISGGAYDFVAAVVEKEAPGIFKRGWNFIKSLFDSKTAQKETVEKTLAEYERQQALILEHARAGATFSVVILLNKAFPLLVGARQSPGDAYKTFVPMKIQTRVVELDVGINAYFKITDQERFVLHYLCDRTLFSTTHILDEISDMVRVVVQDVLKDCEPDDSGKIPEAYHKILKAALNNAESVNFFGLEIVRIVEITAANEGLARFSELAKEMYLSEKELDFLKRTNDFKNRLAEATNSQQIHEAKTALELQQALDKINCDELLHQDEIEKFKKLLENERIVREAKSDEERDRALAEIERTGLIRKHDLEALKLQQANALQLLQLREQLEFERVRTQGQIALDEIKVKAELNIQAQKDDYADTRFYKDLEKRRASEDLDYEQEKRRREMEMEEDRVRNEQFMAQMAAKNKHELDLEKERSRREMSESQILAEKVSAEVAGETIAKKYNNEAERVANERIIEAYKENMKFMQSMMAGQAANPYAGGTPSFGGSAGARPPAPAQTHVAPPTGVFCGDCGAKNPAGTAFCGACGARLG